jgi:hypothetical protein
MSVVLETWSCKEVYCIIQFLWAENVFPGKFNHQLSVGWWHTESVGCQNMLQSVKKWSDVHDDDCCEHSTSEGTGLPKLTSHNLKSVCWTGMVNRNCVQHCPLRTWIPQSMFMLHTEMSGGWHKNCYFECAVSHFHGMQRDTFAFWYAPVKWRCTKMDVCVCVCVYVHVFFSLSLCIYRQFLIRVPLLKLLHNLSLCKLELMPPQLISYLISYVYIFTVSVYCTCLKF